MISAYLRDRLLDQVLRSADFRVERVWVSLHETDPGEHGSGELPLGVARQRGVFASAENGASVNTEELVWSDLPVSTVVFVGLWDAARGGNFLWGGPLVQRRHFADPGFRLVIDAGGLEVSLD